MVLCLYSQSWYDVIKFKTAKREHVRDEFKKNSQLSKTDILHIEYLIRRGKKKLKEIEIGSWISMGSFVKNKSDK